MSRRSMILAAFFYNPQGDHRLSWRHPRAPRHEIFGLDYYRRLAEAAERAKLDTIFIADEAGTLSASRFVDPIFGSGFDP